MKRERRTDYSSEAMLRNQAARCEHTGCSSLRWGFSGLCQKHGREAAARRSEITARAMATRRARYPHFFKDPKTCDEYWRGAAGNAVKMAVTKGILPSLASGEYACVDCGRVACQYEHRDYSRPLDVEPVCRSCNKRRGSAKYPEARTFARLDSPQKKTA